MERVEPIFVAVSFGCQQGSNPDGISAVDAGWLGTLKLGGPGRPRWSSSWWERGTTAAARHAEQLRLPDTRSSCGGASSHGGARGLRWGAASASARPDAAASVRPLVCGGERAIRDGGPAVLKRWRLPPCSRFPSRRAAVLQLLRARESVGRRPGARGRGTPGEEQQHRRRNSRP